MPFLRKEKKEVIGSERGGKVDGNRKRGSCIVCIHTRRALAAREWPCSSLPVSVTRIRFAASDHFVGRFTVRPKLRRGGDTRREEKIRIDFGFANVPPPVLRHVPRS